MNAIEVAESKFFAKKGTMIIAEIGVNHDGSVDRAMDLVRVAANCGADALKVQIFHADRLLHTSSALAEYQRESILDETPLDMLRRYELSEPDLQRIVRTTGRESLTTTLLATLGP